MTAISQWPIRASLAVVSDIHLHHPDDSKARTLLAILEQLAFSDLEYFVLLGDIFDFTLGSSRYYRRKFAAIGAALSRLAAHNTKVLFVEGNHEFDMQHFRWPGVQVIPEGNYILNLRNGARVKLTHGDMLAPHARYAAFRKFVKSPFVTTCASFVPGRVMDMLTLKSAQISRAADEHRTINHEKLLHVANNWLDADQVEHGIFGHYHVPYAEPRLNRDGLILSLDCWDKPNMLVLTDDHEFWRYEFPAVNSDFIKKKAQPFLGDS